MHKQLTSTLAQGDQTPVVLKGANQEMIFEGMQVEVFEFEEQVLFNPKHVGLCLGMSDATVRDHLRQMNENKRIKLTNSNVGSTNFRKLHNTGEVFITESGVYDLIFKSKKQEAIKFKDWVTDEVLPSLRKHGAYMTDDTIEKALTEPDFLIRLATKLKEEKELRIKAEAQIEADKPKVLFADAVSVSKTSILIGELAKILKQNGVDTGEKRLFTYLRDNGYLIKRKGTDYNSPTQKAMELSLFEVKETTVTHSDGHVTINKTTKVTGKGQQYFINKFLYKKGA